MLSYLLISHRNRHTERVPHVWYLPSQYEASRPPPSRIWQNDRVILRHHHLWPFPSPTPTPSFLSPVYNNSHSLLLPPVLFPGPAPPSLADTRSRGFNLRRQAGSCKPTPARLAWLLWRLTFGWPLCSFSLALSHSKLFHRTPRWPIPIRRSRRPLIRFQRRPAWCGACAMVAIVPQTLALDLASGGEPLVKRSLHSIVHNGLV